jgi:catechol 2,3-dioxygenase-like lactoylglutathione lyase family enzyme
VTAPDPTRDAPELVLDHVQIAAPPGAEAAARHFFGEVLGLGELPKPHPLSLRGGVWFACGSQQLHVGIERDFRPARKAHVALRVPSAEALARLRARLEALGVPTRNEDEPPGTARFFADDPWGNRIEFLAGV